MITLILGVAMDCESFGEAHMNQTLMVGDIEVRRVRFTPNRFREGPKDLINSLGIMQSEKSLVQSGILSTDCSFIPSQGRERPIRKGRF